MRLLLCLVALLAATPSAAEEPRVAGARLRRGAEVARLFRTAKVAYPPAQLYLRAFKREQLLEVWAASLPGERLTRIASYGICGESGLLGPKRAQGDGQIPEGLYRVRGFNPWSAAWLSFQLDYPNRSDRLRGARRPGGNVFVHGSCVSVGCLAIADDIEALYLIAADTRAAGVREIPVHVFPGRFDAAGRLALAAFAEDVPRLASFWNELAPAFEAFERTRRPPAFRIDAAGRYRVEEVVTADVSAAAGSSSPR